MQKIITDIKLDFDDILIRPKRSNLSSRSEVNITRDFHFLHSPRQISAIPIMVANMDTTGTFNMAKEVCSQGGIVSLHKHYSNEQLIDFYSNETIPYRHLVFYSTGTTVNDIEKLTHIFNTLRDKGRELPNICVDVANGYSEKFVKTVAHIRKLYDNIIIMAGNVVTPEMVEELLLHGKIDIVKIGIGPGSVCTTRLKTGIGYPQASAIMECSDAAHGLGGHICGDGGCKSVGDICKAFGCNADFVMCGGFFAGTDECEGEWEYDAEMHKISLKFYGMSSKEAMHKHHNGVAHYRTSEGKCVTVSYKGPVVEILKDIFGGIRSSCTYIGASKIKDFGKKTTFILVNDTHNRIYEK
ncbi:MAG: GMP reductase [Sphingobacteriia bacterium]|nr:GMP reductase [Sphingobacteriia bacterium]